MDFYDYIKLAIKLTLSSCYIEEYCIFRRRRKKTIYYVIFLYLKDNLLVLTKQKPSALQMIN